MNKLHELIYNEGERLIPYVTHDEAELIRHRSSYAFFHTVISLDLHNNQQLADNQIDIVDLGFGTGYGPALLSSIPNANITGVDISPECEIFALQYYPRRNVNYVIEDLQTYVPRMPAFDYVVSRGVLEHVPNGIKLIKDMHCKKRIMIDVPYKEKPGNEHHVLTGITEADFEGINNCEFFYEDLQGNIYDSDNFPSDANMIMIVVSDPTMPKIKDILTFPIVAVKSNELETLSETFLSSPHYHFDSPEELLSCVKKEIKQTEVVADIGCGIVPMNYFRPKLHIMIEPWSEYTDILAYRHSGDKTVLILKLKALEALQGLASNSVDSIFMLDVIEHIEKEEGYQVIKECERVARQQVIIFTPLGFMFQIVEEGGKDGWGLSGGHLQDHLSGWLPEDFSKDWTFYICKGFHKVDHLSRDLSIPHGAFFAIRNFKKTDVIRPEIMSDFRRLLPSEIALNDTQEQLQNTQEQLQNTQEQLQNTQEQLQNTQEQLQNTQEQLQNTQGQLQNTQGQLQNTQEQLKNVQIEFEKTKRLCMYVPLFLINHLRKFKQNYLTRLNSRAPLPLVSVIIPTFNRDKFIGEAIQSILNQTYKNLEVIVVDDGSQDRTKEIVSSFQDGRVLYFYQTNKGRSAARNLALKHAKGEYITFLDSDDSYHKDKIKKQVKFFERNKEFSVVYTSATCVDESGNCLNFKYKANDSGWIYSKVAYFASSPITLPTVMLRREVLSKIGSFDEALHRFEDTDMWRRIAKEYQIGAIKETTCLLRTHGDNSLKNQDPEIIMKNLEYYINKVLSEDVNYGAFHDEGIDSLLNYYKAAFLSVPEFSSYTFEISEIQDRVKETLKRNYYNEKMCA
jgi:glycosyltransferase involved in cell wall biosynthesis/2-polyprenyl-3-methyl-5-hydroxy-6-metoxy-1,4-benzoquinol methylase